MAGATSSVERFLTDLPKQILPNIGGEPTREALINLHRLVSGNSASVALNLGVGRHGHLTLTMTSEEYTEQADYVFVMPYKTGDYPPTMGTP